MKKPPPIQYLQQLFQQEQYEELISAARLTLTEDPENVRALYWRACAFMRLSMMEEALEDLDQAIDLFDEYADAISQRGVLFFHKKELVLAMEDMDRAVELDPENPYRYSSRAYIKSTMDEIDSAIEDYQKAVELDPEDAVAHNNLGLLQEKLGYKSQAMRNLEKAEHLMVNEAGELVEQNTPPLTPQAPGDLSPKATYYSIIRDVFTTKNGFTGYWKYLKTVFSKRPPEKP